MITKSGWSIGLRNASFHQLDASSPGCYAKMPGQFVQTGDAVCDEERSATAPFLAPASPTRARNAEAIDQGRVELRLGSVEALPFADETFDKAVATNSMQVWPDCGSGLREISRVLKPGGSLALGLHQILRQSKGSIAEQGRSFPLDRCRERHLSAREREQRPTSEGCT
jgi:SAM-dependent methyltransferase